MKIFHDTYHYTKVYGCPGGLIGGMQVPETFRKGKNTA